MMSGQSCDVFVCVCVVLDVSLKVKAKKEVAAQVARFTELLLADAT